MKSIAVTQRVYVDNEYGLRYDQLDQKWVAFLQTVNIKPVIIPNNLTFIAEYINQLDIDGIILTGGNSLVPYGGDAPERDAVERYLLEWALNTNVPLLGVCRGMQLIQDYHGNELHPISGHVARRQVLTIKPGLKLSELLSNYSDVNSYHDFGATEVQGEIAKIAEAEDGVVMAIEHVDKQVFGLMWHPEREPIIQDTDQKVFDYIFGPIK